jgi:hypothetical protein
MGAVGLAPTGDGVKHAEALQTPPRVPKNQKIGTQKELEENQTAATSAAPPSPPQPTKN